MKQNREIKFRAWDKEKKIMWPSVGFQDSDDGRIILPELGMINIEDDEKWTQGLREYDRMELMQFTGLKDKNGKEIYEGDIVEGIFYGYEGKLRDRRVAEYKLGGFSIWNKFVEKSDEELDCVIVGNIYENEDLI